MRLADGLHFDAEEGGEFLQFMGVVADADGAVVGWAVGVPLFHECAGSDGEFVTAVGVSDLQDRAREMPGELAEKRFLVEDPYRASPFDNGQERFLEQVA